MLSNESFEDFLNIPAFLLILIVIPSSLYILESLQFGHAALSSQHIGSTGGFPVFAGVPHLLDFENLSIGTPVFNQFPGITFIGGDLPTHPVIINQSALPTVSPKHILQSKVKDIHCSIISARSGRCKIIQDIRFDIPQYRVSLSTGLSNNINPVGERYTILLQGWTSIPHTTGSILIAQDISRCLGKGPTPIMTPLRVNDNHNQSRIRYAEIALVKCNNANASPSSGSILVDNLLYNRPLNAPIREDNPPVFTSISPGNGSTVFGSTPGLIGVTLTANVSETELHNMTVQVNNQSPIPVPIYQTSSNNYTSYVNLGKNDGIVNGSNTVVFTATDADRPPNIAKSSTEFTFTPAPFSPSTNPSQLDIWPTAVEVTQSIDHGPLPLELTNYDLASETFQVAIPKTPPLFQDKSTLIRIYGASNSDSPVDNVPAVMTISKENCPVPIPEIKHTKSVAPSDQPSKSGGCIIGEENIPPNSNLTAPNTAGITVQPLGTAEGDPKNLASDLANTWDFLIPPNMTKQDLKVDIQINNGKYSHFPPVREIKECNNNEPMQCQNNNSLELHLHFQPAQTMIINPIYLHGIFTNGPTVVPKEDQVDNIFQVLDEIFPFHVIQGNRYDTGISGGSSANDVLDTSISGFVSGDFTGRHDPGFFLGLLPSDQARFAANNGGVIGLGYVGKNGAWADADEPVASAHETFHNIGFEHWGCEHGATDDECSVYPYHHGAIDIYQTDIVHWNTHEPGDITGRGPHNHDLMIPSTQQGNWISEYDFNIILSHHTPGSYDPDDPPALSMHGTISPGNTTIQPVYHVNVTTPILETNMPEDDTEQLFTIQGYDCTGNTIFVHNFEPNKIDNHISNFTKFTFSQLLPDIHSVRKLILLRGPLDLGSIDSTCLNHKPQIHIIEPTNNTEWPLGTRSIISWTISNSNIGKSLPALVLYSPDGGKTVLPLGRNIQGNMLVVNPDEIPGSNNATISVQVSNGLDSGIAHVSSIRAPFKPPTVHIISPTNLATRFAHLPLDLQGTASDRQDTLLNDTQFTWSSNIDGELGTGRHLTPNTLSVGLHKITLSVTDSHGLSGSDTIQLNIK